jgi:hypothetical protein
MFMCMVLVVSDSDMTTVTNLMEQIEAAAKRIEAQTVSLLRELGEVERTLAGTQTTEGPNPLDAEGILLPDVQLPPHSTDTYDALVPVLVLSSRCNFDQRKSIRETWANGVGHVFFVVGRRWCEYPPKAQSWGHACKLRESQRTKSSFACSFDEHNTRERGCSDGIAVEQSTHNDMMIVDVADSYGALSEKLLASMVHVSQLVKNFSAVMKVDDDCLVDIRLLRLVVASEFAPLGRYWGVGSMHTSRIPMQSGEWIDRNYKKIYPDYPQGNKGYVLSASVVTAIAQAHAAGVELIHGNAMEDTRVAIWTTEVLNISKQMKWNNSVRFAGEKEGCKDEFWGECHTRIGRQQKANFDTNLVEAPTDWCPVVIMACCQNKELLTFGHLLTPLEMRDCYRHRLEDASPDCPKDLFRPTTGQCMGLLQLNHLKNTERDDEETCRKICCASIDCEVWQWRSRAEEAEWGGCWVSNDAKTCDDKPADPEFPFVGGVKLRAQCPPGTFDRTTPKCDSLVELASGNADAKTCETKCCASLACTAWQWLDPGSEVWPRGCWVSTIDQVGKGSCSSGGSGGGWVGGVRVVAGTS